MREQDPGTETGGCRCWKHEVWGWPWQWQVEWGHQEDKAKDGPSCRRMLRSPVKIGGEPVASIRMNGGTGRVVLGWGGRIWSGSGLMRESPPTAPAVWGGGGGERKSSPAWGASGPSSQPTPGLDFTQD